MPSAPNLHSFVPPIQSFTSFIPPPPKKKENLICTARCCSTPYHRERTSALDSIQSRKDYLPIRARCMITTILFWKVKPSYRIPVRLHRLKPLARPNFRAAGARSLIIASSIWVPYSLRQGDSIEPHSYHLTHSIQSVYSTGFENLINTSVVQLPATSAPLPTSSSIKIFHGACGRSCDYPSAYTAFSIHKQKQE